MSAASPLCPAMDDFEAQDDKELRDRELQKQERDALNVCCDFWNLF